MVCGNAYSLFLAFVKELPLTVLSLLPSAIMLHVLTLISANIIGPGDELDITFLSKLIRKHQIDHQPPHVNRIHEHMWTLQNLSALLLPVSLTGIALLEPRTAAAGTWEFKGKWRKNTPKRSGGTFCRSGLDFSVKCTSTLLCFQCPFSTVKFFQPAPNTLLVAFPAALLGELRGTHCCTYHQGALLQRRHLPAASYPCVANSRSHWETGILLDGVFAPGAWLLIGPITVKVL